MVKLNRKRGHAAETTCEILSRHLMTGVLALAIVCGIGSPLCAQKTSTGSDVIVINQAEHSFAEALAKGDKAAVGTLLDAKFEWTDADGKMREKAQTLQDLSALAAETTDETDIKTHNYGQLGRVAGTHHNLNFVRLWVKRPEGWRAFIILEAPVPTKVPHPTAPKESDKDCVNPCKMLPYKPSTPGEQAAVDTWLKLKMDEWHAIPDDWKTHVGESMVIFSPTMAMNKAQRLELLTKQKEAYGDGSPSAPVESMHLYEFWNSVIMTAIHGPNAAGKPSYAVRIFTSEEGDWKIVLSSQTDINHPNGASD
ncbi:MAG TPA: nuclear transport factor 2 family protein [Candidatus Acidoferrum sp.]|jgi:hypothetical protein